jgi:hypothetical protein
MSLRRWKGKLQRFVRLDTEDRLLLLRAVFWIGVARLWLAAFPFQRLASRLSAEDGLDDADPELVGAAGAHVPWRSDCFPRSIAAHQLLKSHGYASTIHLGVEKAGNGELLGHAWVTCGGIVVTGGEQLDRYAEIHRLGAARPKVTLGE